TTRVSPSSVRRRGTRRGRSRKAASDRSNSSIRRRSGSASTSSGRISAGSSCLLAAPRSSSISASPISTPASPPVRCASPPERTRAPVGEALVTLRADDSAHRRKDQGSVPTGSDGRLELARVVLGRYELEIFRGESQHQELIELRPAERRDLGDIPLGNAKGF